LKNYCDGVLTRTVSDNFSIFSRKFGALGGRSRVQLPNQGSTSPDLARIADWFGTSLQTLTNPDRTWARRVRRRM